MQALARAPTNQQHPANSRLHMTQSSNPANSSSNQINIYQQQVHTNLMYNTSLRAGQFVTGSLTIQQQQQQIYNQVRSQGGQQTPGSLLNSLLSAGNDNGSQHSPNNGNNGTGNTNSSSGHQQDGMLLGATPLSPIQHSAPHEAVSVKYEPTTQQQHSNGMHESPQQQQQQQRIHNEDDLMWSDNPTSASDMAENWELLTQFADQVTPAGDGSGNDQTLVELKTMGQLPPFTGFRNVGRADYHSQDPHPQIQHPQQPQQAQLPNASPSEALEFYDHNIVSSTSVDVGNHQQSMANGPQIQRNKGPGFTTDLSNYFDFAELLGSAMADTTTSQILSNGNSASNGPATPVGQQQQGQVPHALQTAIVSEGAQNPWGGNPMDEEWLDPEMAYSMAQHQQQQQQQQQLPTMHTYAPLLQQRLQQSNMNETPSSTSTLSPLGGGGGVGCVSTSESAQELHSSMGNVVVGSGRKRSKGGKKGGANNNTGSGSCLSTAEQLNSPYGAGGLTAQGKERPYHKCPVCQRGFLNKSNIKVHLRTHTGDKPFKCETCSKNFRQKAHLIKHQQIHKRHGRE